MLESSECDITRRSHVFVMSFFIAIINHEVGALSSVFHPIVGKVKEQNAMIKWLSDYSLRKSSFGTEVQNKQ